jgi:hypothetical protein
LTAFDGDLSKGIRNRKDRQIAMLGAKFDQNDGHQLGSNFAGLAKISVLSVMGDRNQAPNESTSTSTELIPKILWRRMICMMES